MMEEILLCSFASADDSINNFNIIHYQVDTNIASELINHNNIINKELRLRSMPTIGTLESKRVTLIVRMKNEHQLKNLKTSLNYEKPDIREFYSLLTVMSCIFQGEIE